MGTEAALALPAAGVVAAWTEAEIRFARFCVCGLPFLAWLVVRRWGPVPRGGAPGLPGGLLPAAVAATAWFAALVAGGLVLAVTRDTSLEAALALAGVSGGAAVAAGLVAMRRLAPEAPAADEGPSPAPARAAILAGLAAAAALLPVVWAVGLGTHEVLEAVGLPVRRQRVVEAAIAEGGRRFAVVAVYAVLVAPFTEEWFFRGFLFAGLRRRFGFAASAAASATAFGAVHVEWTGEAPSLMALPGTAVLGLAACGLRERTGGMAAPLACHAAYNALVLGAARLLVAPS